MHIGVHNVDYTPPKKWEPIPPKLQSLYCLIFHILLSWACLTFPQIVTTSTFFPFSRYWKGEQLMGAQIWWVFNLFLWRFKGETLMSFPSSKKVNTEKEQLKRGQKSKGKWCLTNIASLKGASCLRGSLQRGYWPRQQRVQKLEREVLPPGAWARFRQKHPKLGIGSKIHVSLQWFTYAVIRY